MFQPPSATGIGSVSGSLAAAQDPGSLGDLFPFPDTDDRIPYRQHRGAPKKDTRSSICSRSVSRPSIRPLPPGESEVTRSIAASTGRKSAPSVSPAKARGVCLLRPLSEANNYRPLQNITCTVSAGRASVGLAIPKERTRPRQLTLGKRTRILQEGVASGIRPQMSVPLRSRRIPGHQHPEPTCDG